MVVAHMNLKLFSSVVEVASPLLRFLLSLKFGQGDRGFAVRFPSTLTFLSKFPSLLLIQEGGGDEHLLVIFKRNKDLNNFIKQLSFFYREGSLTTWELDTKQSSHIAVGSFDFLHRWIKRRSNFRCLRIPSDEFYPINYLYEKIIELLERECSSNRSGDRKISNLLEGIFDRNETCHEFLLLFVEQRMFMNTHYFSFNFEIQMKYQKNIYMEVKA